MSEENPELNSELSSLEATLASLAPATKLDRDSILYEAGRAAVLAENRLQASGQQRLLTWATALLLLVSLTTTALWVWERESSQAVVDNPPGERERPSIPKVQPPFDAPPPNESELVEDGMEFTFVRSPARNYFELRDKVLAEGADVLPQPKSRRSRPIPTLRSEFEGI